MNFIFYIIYPILLGTGIVLYFVKERVWEKDLTKIAKINSISNAEFLLGDADDVLTNLMNSGKKFSTFF